MPNIIANIIMAAASLLNSRAWLSRMLPRAIQANIVAISHKTVLGHLPDIDSLLLLRKIFASGSYLTLLHWVIKYGTNIKVSHIMAELTSAGTSSNSESVTDTEVPTVIPSQNIKFQKLSLFQEKHCTCVLLTGDSSVNVSISSVCTLSIKRLNLQLVVNYLKIITNIVALFAPPIKHLTTFLLCLSVTFSFNLAIAVEIPQLISEAEKKHNIPSGLLAAIAKVESNSKPYAINVSGKSIIASSKEEAIRRIRSYLNKGHTNIDIGIMQINWHWHQGRFSNLEEMLDPHTNIEYAAKLLTALYQQHGTWQKSVRFYHSAKENYHRKYSRAVLISWMQKA